MKNQFWPIVFLFFGSSSASSFWSWLGWEADKNEKLYSSSGVPLLQIPFEELDPEEKFILEASKITGMKLSDLDVCQQKIIMRLKSSCGSLNDEELARLAIHLLNCQAAVEGRRIYACTDEMSLKQCSGEMSPDAWNTYHIMSNRARAVCYVARQQHFRALAEMMVNKLVDTTQSHLTAIDNYQEKQKTLQSATEFSLQRLSKSQQEVLMSYGKIRAVESALAARIDLSLEKSKDAQNFIDSSHTLLSEMMVEFQKGIEKSGQQIALQMNLRVKEQLKLVNEINELKQMVLEIKSKMVSLQNNEDVRSQSLRNKSDESSAKLVEKDAHISKSYDEAFKRLGVINSSLDHIVSWLGSAKTIFSKHIETIEDLAGRNGENLDEKLFLLSHVLSLFLAMVLYSFMYVPVIYRWFLVFGAPANWYLNSEIYKTGISDSLIYFYGVMTTVILVDTTIRFVPKLKKITSRKNTETKLSNGTIRKSGELAKRGTNFSNHLTPVIEDDESVTKVNDWLTSKYNRTDNHLSNGFLDHTSTPYRPVDNDLDNTSDISLRKRLPRNSTPSRSVASSGKILCHGVNKNGTTCRNSALKNSELCRIHLSQAR